MAVGCAYPAAAAAAAVLMPNRERGRGYQFVSTPSTALDTYEASGIHNLRSDVSTTLSFLRGVLSLILHHFH